MKSAEVDGSGLFESCMAIVTPSAFIPVVQPINDGQKTETHPCKALPVGGTRTVTICDPSRAGLVGQSMFRPAMVWPFSVTDPHAAKEEHPVRSTSPMQLLIAKSS